MLLAITDLMPRLIFSLLWLWSKNTAPEHRQLEPIQDLNFKLDIQTKACRSLDILFFFCFSYLQYQICRPSHQGLHKFSFSRSFFENWKWFWIFLKLIFFFFLEKFYNKYLLMILISKVLYFLEKSVPEEPFLILVTVVKIALRLFKCPTWNFWPICINIAYNSEKIGRIFLRKGRL